MPWSRIDRRAQRIASPRFRDQLPGLIGESSGGCLASGLLRSYGDCCVNRLGTMIDMTGLDRVISFDAVKGIVRAEAGASLSDILSLAVPNGWFLPTTPGTRFITLGGAVANDVHGKNHHRVGSFGRHVNSLGLVRSDGFRGVVTAEDETAGLFGATIGGLGLTGIIEWVEVRLARIQSAYLDVETIPFSGLAECWKLAGESTDSFEHTVAWMDCSSRGLRSRRGIFSRANWREDREYRPHEGGAWPSVPADAPSFLLNRISAAAFNELYFRFKQARTGRSRQHYAKFFYPLDAVRGWNRLYGKRGMRQYQCVIPCCDAREVITTLLEEISRSDQIAFLAVLKNLGPHKSPGLLSFPRSGLTLAVDFANEGGKTLTLFAILDRIVADAGGALYPAKDGRLPSQLFRCSFPRWHEFLYYRDPGMTSDLWRRVAS